VPAAPQPPPGLQLVRSFSLPVPPDHAFGVMTDAELLADVVPGTTLHHWDGTSFTASVRLRLGMLPVVGHGTGRIAVRDAKRRHAVIEVASRDGVLVAAVTVTVDEHSTVVLLADLLVPPAAGRVGRSVVTELGNRMFAQASTTLVARLHGQPPPAAAGGRLGVPRSVTRALGRPGAAVADAAVATAGVAVAVVRYALRRR